MSTPCTSLYWRWPGQTIYLVESPTTPLKARTPGCREMLSSNNSSPSLQMRNALRGDPHCSPDSKWQQAIDLSNNGICWSVETKHPRGKHGFRWGLIHSSNSAVRGRLPLPTWLPSQNLSAQSATWWRQHQPPSGPSLTAFHWLW